jgi:hypothetical protein
MKIIQAASNLRITPIKYAVGIIIAFYCAVDHATALFFATKQDGMPTLIIPMNSSPKRSEHFGLRQKGFFFRSVKLKE